MGSIKDYTASNSREHTEYRSIVCPINDSTLSIKGEEIAAYLSKLSGARLILLTVVTKWNSAEPMTTDSREWSDIHDMWIDERKKPTALSTGYLINPVNQMILLSRSYPLS